MKYKTIFLVLGIFTLHFFSILQVNTTYLVSNINKKNASITIRTSEKDSWYKIWGGIKAENAYALTLDSTGNIYVAGETNSFHLGETDVFLLKYNSSGELLWDEIWVEGRYCFFGDLTMDSINNIYITGSTNFGFPTNTDVFLLKYTISGKLEWDIIWGGNDWDTGYSVMSDSNDNIYVSGFTQSYGPHPVEIFLMKVNNTGDLLWNITWGGDEEDIGRDLEIDSSDNLYILGETESYGSGSKDICLLKFNNLGVLKWNETWGGNQSEQATSLKLDSSDNIYILGENQELENFLLKYNSSGHFQWNSIWGGNITAHVRALEIDSFDNVYVAGEILNEIYLLKINASGELQWNYTWKEGEKSSCRAIEFDSYNNIYITGEITYKSGATDIIVLKFNRDGDLKGYIIWGGDNLEYSSIIVSDPFGNLYVAGNTRSYGNGRTDVVLLKNPSYSYEVFFTPSINIWANILGFMSGILCWYVFQYHINLKKKILFKSERQKVN